MFIRKFCAQFTYDLKLQHDEKNQSIGSQLGHRFSKMPINRGLAGCRLTLPQPKKSTALKGVVFFFCFIKVVKGFEPGRFCQKAKLRPFSERSASLWASDRKMNKNGIIKTAAFLLQISML